MKYIGIFTDENVKWKFHTNESAKNRSPNKRDSIEAKVHLNACCIIHYFTYD